MKRNFRRLPSLALLLAGATLALSSVTARAQAVQQVTGIVDDSQRVTLKGNTPPLAQAKYDQGIVGSSTPANHMLLVLKRSDSQESDLKKLIADQHNPSSANFHKWLKPGDFGKQFGIEDSDLETVKAWLQSKGFTINKVNAGRTVVDFSGTAGQVGSAFHTELHTYLRNGRSFHANNKDPEIPAALAPVVKGLASLNDIKPKSFLTTKGRVSLDSKSHLGTPLWNDPVCGSSSTPGSPCTYYIPTPADIATQYSLQSVHQKGIAGAGQTIGIISASNVDMSNVQNYRKFFNVANPTNLPQTIVDGEDPGQNSAAEEAYLDLEVSGALAPAAAVDLYVSADTLTTTGLYTALVRAVDDDLADVISLSYGECEQELGSAGNQFFYYNWQQATAQGQSVFVAAGDSGSAGCDSADNPSPAVNGLAVSGFASTPYNVAVGGTDFYYSQYSSGYGSSAVNSQLAQYWGTGMTDGQAASLTAPLPEQPWNDTLGLNLGYPTGYSIAAGSGGPSSCATGVNDPASGTYDSCIAGYPKPSWQVGPGVYPDGVRDLPDVALFAADGANLSLWPICIQAEDCTNYTTDSGSTGITGVGGTSASSPAMAGIMALVDQAQKGRQGNPNFVLYALAAQYPSTFNDVAVGSNNVICYPDTPDCSPDGSDPYDSLHLFPAAKGYDMASGLGSINAANLIANWSRVKLTSTTTTLGLSATSAAHGVPVTANVTVSSSSGTPTGSVALVTTSTLPGQSGQGAITLNDGTGSSTVILPGGSYKVTADYSGDGKFGTSDSSAVAITVTPETSTTALTIDALVPNYEAGFNPTPVANGSSLPYGYTLVLDAGAVGTSGQGYATGHTTFIDTANGSTIVGTANDNVSGVAELQIYRLAAGRHSIVAEYSGDGSFRPSRSAPITFTITKGTPYVYSEDDSPYAPVYAGQPFSVPFVIAGSQGLAPTGNATVTLGTRTLSVPLTSVMAEGQPMATGTAVFSNLPAGSYSLTINYPGDANYVAASSYPEPVTVVPVALLPSTTILSSSTLNAGNNGTFTLTARVTGNHKTTPTGGVLFYLNGLLVNYPAVPLTNGVATLTLTTYNLFTGINHASAQYLGDTNYRDSNSQALTITGNEGDFSISVSNPNLVIPSGGSSTAILTTTSLLGLGGTVNLKCATSSPSISCGLLPSSFSLPTNGAQRTTAIAIETRPDGIHSEPFGQHNAAPGNYKVVITASDAGVVHTAILDVTVSSQSR